MFLYKYVLNLFISDILKDKGEGINKYCNIVLYIVKFEGTEEKLRIIFQIGKLREHQFSWMNI